VRNRFKPGSDFKSQSKGELERFQKDKERSYFNLKFESPKGIRIFAIQKVLLQYAKGNQD
jgi:hypothetical protein